MLLAYLLSFFPELDFLVDLLPKHIPHEYSELMKQKSDIITMPVLMKDEKKYADCVDVMDTLETWIHDICTKATNLPLPAPVPPPPQIFAPARPDQPASHSLPEENLKDPLGGVKVQPRQRRETLGTRLAHLHNGARALSSPSRFFQLPTNLGKNFFRYL